MSTAPASNPTHPPAETHVSAHTPSLGNAHLGTGNVVAGGTGSLQSFAHGMTTMMTDIAVAAGNATGGHVLAGQTVADSGDVPVGTGTCHYKQCFNVSKTGLCAGGHVVKCHEASCAGYMQYVPPGHQHRAKDPVQGSQSTTSAAPQEPGARTVGMGTGSVETHGHGNVVLGSYGTGQAVSGATPLGELASSMDKALTGVAAQTLNASGGSVVSAGGSRHESGSAAGSDECANTHCHYFNKAGFCHGGHTVQCMQNDCASHLHFVPPGHVHGPR